ncbi:MAG: hypothetical protein DRP38_08080 [Thermotogae bacterium]|nr:MAG: hypothetical protein DRP38_08080 [Thermotogota bacterium]
MSTRTIVLLIIMGGVWGVALFFLLHQPSPRKVAIVSFRSKNVLNRLTKIRIPPDIMEEWEILTNEKASEIMLFEPARINFNVNLANESILAGAPRLQRYEFLGFIKTKRDLVVFLRSGGKIEEKRLKNLIDNRYLVVHISSLGVLTVDLQGGGFYAIRP